MAKNDEIKAKMGCVVNVINTKPKTTACKSYKAVWIEDESGKEDSEVCIMFTDNQFQNLPRTLPPSCFKLNDMKLGRMYCLTGIRKSTYIVRFKDVNNIDGMYRLSDKKLEKAKELAQKNIEDIPKRSFLSDMLD